MFSSIRTLWKVMDRQDRLFLPVALVLVILTSFTEMFSIGVLLPFISIVTDPAQIQRNVYLNWLYHFWKCQQLSQFILYFSFAMIGVYLFKLIYAVFFSYIQLRYSRRIYNKVVSKLFISFTKQPYLKFISNNTANYSQALLQESNNTMGMVVSLLSLLADVLTIIFIFGLMLTTDFLTTIERS